MQRFLNIEHLAVALQENMYFWSFFQRQIFASLKADLQSTAVLCLSVNTLTLVSMPNHRVSFQRHLNGMKTQHPQ